MTDRLDRQLAFLAEADALKSVLRASRLHDASRHENSAEHSWHVMLHALVLAEHATRPVALDRVLKMLLLHDIVEIDAGDAPIHGDHDPAAQAARERAAADRLFGLLPADQAAALRALWEEFEAAETDDAVFAKSVDRLQPVLSNLASGGGSWQAYSVTRDQLESRVGSRVSRALPTIWKSLSDRLDAFLPRTK